MCDSVTYRNPVCAHKVINLFVVGDRSSSSGDDEEDRLRARLIEKRDKEERKKAKEKERAERASGDEADEMFTIQPGGDHVRSRVDCVKYGGLQKRKEKEKEKERDREKREERRDDDRRGGSDRREAKPYGESLKMMY